MQGNHLEAATGGGGEARVLKDKRRSGKGSEGEYLEGKERGKEDTP